MLKIPYRFLFPAILVFSAIGSYSLMSWTFDVYVLIAFGVFGYVMMKLGFQPINFMLGFVLGGQFELFFRRSMLLGRGDPSIFIEHRMSLVMLVLAVVLAALLILPTLRSKRKAVFAEDEGV
jgi:TctA family transporter